MRWYLLVAAALLLSFGVLFATQPTGMVAANAAATTTVADVRFADLGTVVIAAGELAHLTLTNGS